MSLKMETSSILGLMFKKYKDTKMKHKLYPNPNIFFHLSDQGIVAIDALSKEEFDLTEAYFSRLKFWNGQRSDKLNDIDHDLIEGDLILESPMDQSDWGGDKLSEFCHIASRNPENLIPSMSEEDSARQFVEMSRDKPTSLIRHEPNVINWVKLPAPDLGKIKEDSLYSSLKNRKTTRDFDGTTINLQSLSDLLFISFGYIHGKEWAELAEDNLNSVAERKSSPSGSGVQACDAYLAISNVEGIDAGFYFYDADDHRLGLISAGCDDAILSHIVCDQFWVKGAACALFITVDMHRVWYKASLARAYNYVYLEAGHISQTVLLSATSLGLKTWLSGSMRDEFIAKKLGLDGRRLFPVTSVYLGNGTGNAIPKKIQEMALKLREKLD